MGLEYFCCFHSYLPKIARLSDEESGKLWRALMRYSATGEQPELSPSAMMAFDFISADIDSSKASYNEKCRRNAENGGKRTLANACERYQDEANASERHQTPGKTKTKTKSKTETKTETKTKSNSPYGEDSAPAKEAKKSFGSYGWVKLTDGDYNRLLNDLGEAEVNRCIAYIDELAQSTGNKNRWRDWNLTVRRCHRDGWGLKSGKQMQANTPVEPTEERIRKNADWLDDFLEKQEGGNDI